MPGHLHGKLCDVHYFFLTTAARITQHPNKPLWLKRNHTWAALPSCWKVNHVVIYRCVLVAETKYDLKSKQVLQARG